MVMVVVLATIIIYQLLPVCQAVSWVSNKENRIESAWQPCKTALQVVWAGKEGVMSLTLTPATDLLNPECQVKSRKMELLGSSCWSQSDHHGHHRGWDWGVVCYHSITWLILTDATILLTTTVDSGVDMQKNILQSYKLRMSLFWLVAWKEKWM